MLPPQSNLLGRPPSGQLRSLTLHDCVSHDNGVSPMVVQECGGSWLVAHTPHQVADGVLHIAPTGGDADCQRRGHSVLHWEVQGAPWVEAAALLVGVGEGGQALREVACETHQGECWSVVWGGYSTQVWRTTEVWWSTSVVKQETTRSQLQSSLSCTCGHVCSTYSSKLNEMPLWQSSFYPLYRLVDCLPLVRFVTFDLSPLSTDFWQELAIGHSATTMWGRGMSVIVLKGAIQTFLNWFSKPTTGTGNRNHV